MDLAGIGAPSRRRCRAVPTAVEETTAAEVANAGAEEDDDNAELPEEAEDKDPAEVNDEDRDKDVSAAV